MGPWIFFFLKCNYLSFPCIISVWQWNMPLDCAKDSYLEVWIPLFNFFFTNTRACFCLPLWVTLDKNFRAYIMELVKAMSSVWGANWLYLIDPITVKILSLLDLSSDIYFHREQEFLWNFLTMQCSIATFTSRIEIPLKTIHGELKTVEKK